MTTASARKPDGVGVALNLETPVERAAALAEAADLVLCMSIHPGLSVTAASAMRVREDNWKVVRR